MRGAATDTPARSLREQEAPILAGVPEIPAGQPGGWDAARQAIRVDGSFESQAHIVARPNPRRSGFAAQARSAYASLTAALRAEGLDTGDVAAETVFLSDVAAQARELRSVRRGFFAGRNGAGVPPVALSLVGQPPARHGALLEIQALALRSAPGCAATRRGIRDLPEGASGVVVETPGLRRVFLTGVTGGEPDDRGAFAGQAMSAFLRAEAVLRREGLAFTDVSRTWLHLTDIDRDYAALNLVRRQFYDARRVRPAPASTGIGGRPYPPDRSLSIDLRAASGSGVLAVATLHAPTLNEAPSYGADFSRGTRVRHADQDLVFVSGTASIDAAGRVVAPGDIAGQVERMLINIEALLAGQGATWGHVVSATTYLKRPEFAAPFREVARRRGVAESFPNSLVVADVCRDEWLCEMEALAIVD